MIRLISQFNLAEFALHRDEGGALWITPTKPGNDLNGNRFDTRSFEIEPVRKLIFGSCPLPIALHLRLKDRR